MHLIEFISAVLTLISAYLTYRSNLLAWPISILAVLCYALIFKHYNDLMNLSLQGIFLVQSFLGWFLWNRNSKITRLKNGTFLIPISIIVVFYTLYNLSIKFNGNDIILDSMSSSLSIIAIILTSMRKIESWILWILSNIIMILLFFSNQLYLSASLYFILIFISYNGYFQWRKNLTTA